MRNLGRSDPCYGATEPKQSVRWLSRSVNLKVVIDRPTLATMKSAALPMAQLPLEFAMEAACTILLLAALVSLERPCADH